MNSSKGFLVVIALLAVALCNDKQVSGAVVTNNGSVVERKAYAFPTYEQAVEKFAPYDHIQDPNPQARDAIRAVIDRSRRRREPAYLFINNRLEGNAPMTIKAILDRDD